MLVAVLCVVNGVVTVVELTVLVLVELSVV